MCLLFIQWQNYTQALEVVCVCLCAIVCFSPQHQYEKHTPHQAAIVVINIFFFVRTMREGGEGTAGGSGGGYASFPEGGSADDGSEREGEGENYQPPVY